MTALRLLWVHLRVGVLNELEYRGHLVVQLAQSAMGLAFALGALGVVFSHTDRLAGWSPDELIALLGVYFLIGGLVRTVVQPSMSRLMEDVRQGTLDFTLIKPVDAQVLVTIKHVQVWKLIDVALGVLLTAVALARLGESVGVAQALAFGVALLAGAAMVYSFLLALATLTFWFVRIDNILVIFMAMWEAGRWPVGIYPGWLRHTLTFVVPVAFATSVPAEALAGRLTADTLATAVGLAGLMLLASRWFWRVGLRHYSGASA